MALTPIRWIAICIAGFLVIGVALLNEGRRPERTHVIEGNLERRQSLHSGHATSAARRLRLAEQIDSITRVALRTPVAPVRVFRDAALPVQARAPLDSLAARAVRAVSPVGRVGLDVFFIYDTSRTTRGVYVERFGAAMDYVLPARAGDRCAVILRIGREPSIRRQIVRQFLTEAFSNELLGPCGYYAAFGMPGPQVGAWLRQRGGQPASSAQWNRAAVDFRFGPDAHFRWGQPLLQYLSIDGLRCTAGQPDVCERVIMGPNLRDRTNWKGDVLTQERRYSYYYPQTGLGWRESRLLADMVRTLGRDKFAQFWASAEPTPAAFQKATGQPLGEWTAAWAAEQYGPVSHGPAIDRWTAVVSALILILAVFIGIRVSAHRQFA